MDSQRRTNAPRRTPLPAVTLIVLAAAALVSASSAAREALIYRRTSIARGELWRLLSGHLVHGWPALALVDLGLLAVLGAALERRARSVLVGTLAASAILSSAAVWLLRSDLELYQGSSALVCGVFVALCVLLLTEDTSRVRRVVAVIALALFALKTGLEAAGSLAWHDTLLPGNVETVSLAHAAGGVAGALVATAGALFRRACTAASSRSSQSAGR